jgi:hypothetical protein
MEKNIEGIPHIPLEDAARELGTTPPRILMLIRQGVMKGRLTDDEWLVAKPTLACFITFEKDAGKSRKCGVSCSSGRCGGGH